MLIKFSSFKEHEAHQNMDSWKNSHFKDVSLTKIVFITLRFIYTSNYYNNNENKRLKRLYNLIYESVNFRP